MLIKTGHPNLHGWDFNEFEKFTISSVSFVLRLGTAILAQCYSLGTLSKDHTGNAMRTGTRSEVLKNTLPYPVGGTYRLLRPQMGVRPSPRENLARFLLSHMVSTVLFMFHLTSYDTFYINVNLSP